MTPVELFAALTGLAPLELVADARLPRMPAFERLLGRARALPASGDWRRWALAVAGLEAPPGDLPVGRTLAEAAGLAGDSGTWLLVEPVRLEAGLSSVQLNSAGVLSLSAAAAAELAARFNAELGDAAFRLHAAGATLLLEARAALALSSTDPEPYAGRDVGAALPAGADGGSLRRLMTELQMWLHGAPPHSLEGPAVNALWPWGAGRGALLGAGHWPELLSADPFLLSVAAAGAGRVRPGVRLQHWRFGAFVADPEPLARLEAECFAPLEAALARGRLTRATLHYAGRAYELTRAQRLKAWVRPRPWWELGL